MAGWRKTSVFGNGRRTTLDRNARARFAYFIRQDRRANRISATGEDVALVLVSMLGDDGRLDPSHATITARVGCDIATTQRCLNRLNTIGRVKWERRLRRDKGTGWRVEQTSNAYELCAEATDPHSASAVSSLYKNKKMKPEMPSEADRANARRQLRALGIMVADDW